MRSVLFYCSRCSVTGSFVSPSLQRNKHQRDEQESNIIIQLSASLCLVCLIPHTGAVQGGQMLAQLACRVATHLLPPRVRPCRDHGNACVSAAAIRQKRVTSVRVEVKLSANATGHTLLLVPLPGLKRNLFSALLERT